MPSTDYIDDPCVWIRLLGGCISAAREDVIGFRKNGYLLAGGEVSPLAKSQLVGRHKMSGNRSVRGYARLDDLVALADFVYRGGIDQMLHSYGQPAAGAMVVDEIEREIAGLPLLRRRLKPVRFRRKADDEDEAE